MNILERIKNLEQKVKHIRIIDSEDIIAENTGRGIALHLEDPFMDSEDGENYKGYFKVIQTATNKIKIVDGFADDPTTYTKAGDVLINDTIFTDIAAVEFTITADSFIYLIVEESFPPTPYIATIQKFTSKQSYELGKSKTLISRVKFADSKISKFSQEIYGMIIGTVDGDCDS